jgi:hypothetical protein
VTVIQDGEMIFFSGIGLPGRTVEVLIKNSPVNLTIVNADSSWEVGIPSSRFSDGPVTPVFKFGDEYYESSVKISVGNPDGGLSKLLWLAIMSILTLGLLGAAFVYFFVEIDGDESTDDSSEIIEESEGWIWDESSNDWIEDPDYES